MGLQRCVFASPMEPPGPVTTILASPGQSWRMELVLEEDLAPSARPFSTCCGWISVSSAVTQLCSDLIENQDRATPAFSQPRTRGAAVYVQSSCMACHCRMYGDER